MDNTIFLLLSDLYNSLVQISVLGWGLSGWMAENARSTLSTGLLSTMAHRILRHEDLPGRGRPGLHTLKD